MAVQRSVSRVFEEYDPTVEWMHGGDGAAVVQIFLPGFRRDQVRVQVDSHGALQATGERPLKGNKWSRFKKDLPLPENCNRDGIRADFAGETLIINLPTVAPPAPPSPPPTNASIVSPPPPPPRPSPSPPKKAEIPANAGDISPQSPPRPRPPPPLSKKAVMEPKQPSPPSMHPEASMLFVTKPANTSFVSPARRPPPAPSSLPPEKAGMEPKPPSTPQMPMVAPQSEISAKPTNKSSVSPPRPPPPSHLPKEDMEERKEGHEEVRIGRWIERKRDKVEMEVEVIMRGKVEEEAAKSGVLLEKEDEMEMAEMASTVRGASSAAVMNKNSLLVNMAVAAMVLVGITMSVWSTLRS